MKRLLYISLVLLMILSMVVVPSKVSANEVNYQNNAKYVYWQDIETKLAKQGKKDELFTASRNIVNNFRYYKNGIAVNKSGIPIYNYIEIWKHRNELINEDIGFIYKYNNEEYTRINSTQQNEGVRIFSREEQENFVFGIDYQNAINRYDNTDILDKVVYLPITSNSCIWGITVEDTPHIDLDIGRMVYGVTLYVWNNVSFKTDFYDLSKYIVLDYVSHNIDKEGEVYTISYSGGNQCGIYFNEYEDLDNDEFMKSIYNNNSENVLIGYDEFLNIDMLGIDDVGNSNVRLKNINMDMVYTNNRWLIRGSSFLQGEGYDNIEANTMYINKECTDYGFMYGTMKSSIETQDYNQGRFQYMKFYTKVIKIVDNANIEFVREHIITWSGKKYQFLDISLPYGQGALGLGIDKYYSKVQDDSIIIEGINLNNDNLTLSKLYEPMIWGLEGAGYKKVYFEVLNDGYEYMNVKTMDKTAYEGLGIDYEIDLDKGKYIDETGSLSIFSEEMMNNDYSLRFYTMAKEGDVISFKRPFNPNIKRTKKDIMLYYARFQLEDIEDYDLMQVNNGVFYYELIYRYKNKRSINTYNEMMLYQVDIFTQHIPTQVNIGLYKDDVFYDSIEFSNVIEGVNRDLNNLLVIDKEDDYIKLKVNVEKNTNYDELVLMILYRIDESITSFKPYNYMKKMYVYYPMRTPDDFKDNLIWKYKDWTLEQFKDMIYYEDDLNLGGALKYMTLFNTMLMLFGVGISVIIILIVAKNVRIL